MSFIWPSMLYGLLAIPVIAAGYFRLQQVRTSRMAALGPLAAGYGGGGEAPSRRRHVPVAFYCLGLAVLAFSLARPEMPASLPRIEGTVILAFDVSASMAADDLEPTRIDAARAAARAFVEKQPGSVRIGVVAFSNGGFVVQQPTNDQAAVLEAIDRLSTSGATSLGQGIFTSLNAIADEPIGIDPVALENGEPIDIGRYPSAVVLLLSDGENTGDQDPLPIAQLAANAGVRIYTVGIGSPEGAVIEVDGFQILSQLNEAALQDIAGLTNGAYFRAAEEGQLQEIYDNVDLQLTIRGEQVEVTGILAGFAVLVFLAGGLLSLAWFGRIP